MKRKVIRIADNTHVISLPVSWVTAHSIKKGDQVDVEPHHQDLLIRAKHTSGRKTIEIDCDTLGPLLRRVILRLYQEGYDEIKLRFSDPQLRADIQRHLEQTIGYEIVTQTPRNVTINDLGGNNDTDITQLMRRTLLLLKNMVEEGIIALCEKDYDALAALTLFDIEINKFVYYCTRRIAKSPKIHNPNAPMFYTLLRQTERIGDEYKWAFAYAAKHKITADKDLLRILQGLIDMYVKCYELTFTLRTQTARDIATVYDQLKPLIDAPGKSETPLYRALRTIFNLTAELQELQLPYLNDLDTTYRHDRVEQMTRETALPWADI